MKKDKMIHDVEYCIKLKINMERSKTVRYNAYNLQRMAHDMTWYAITSNLIGQITSKSVLMSLLCPSVRLSHSPAKPNYVISSFRHRFRIRNFKML